MHAHTSAIMTITCHLCQVCRWRTKLHQNLIYKRHSSPTSQQVLNTIGKNVLQNDDFQKGHTCIMHCHR